MSYNSNKNSGSSRSGFIKRELGPQGDKSVRKIESLKRPLEFKVLEGSPPINGRMSKPTMSVSLSTGLRELSPEGYFVYNLPEKDDIYISIQSESDDFNDNVKMVKMEIEDSSNVWSPKRSENSIETDEIQNKSFVHNQASDLFVNAYKKEEAIEVDYTEITIKSNTEEFQNVEESFRPKGLYLEGDEYSTESISDEVVSINSIISSDFLIEPVPTSEAIILPRFCESSLAELINIDDAEYKSDLVEVSKTYAINDIEEILPITIPRLYNDEKSFKDLPEDKDLMIPEDGLESYDFKFKSFEAIKV